MTYFRQKTLSSFLLTNLPNKCNGATTNNSICKNISFYFFLGFSLECNRCDAESKEDCDAKTKMIKCAKDENLCFALAYDNGEVFGDDKTIKRGIEKGCASSQYGCETYCAEHRHFGYRCMVSYLSFRYLLLFDHFVQMVFWK